MSLEKRLARCSYLSKELSRLDEQSKKLRKNIENTSNKAVELVEAALAKSGKTMEQVWNEYLAAHPNKELQDALNKMYDDLKDKQNKLASFEKISFWTFTGLTIGADIGYIDYMTASNPLGFVADLGVGGVLAYKLAGAQKVASEIFVNNNIATLRSAYHFPMSLRWWQTKPKLILSILVLIATARLARYEVELAELAGDATAAVRLRAEQLATDLAKTETSLVEAEAVAARFRTATRWCSRFGVALLVGLIVVEGGLIWYNHKLQDESNERLQKALKELIPARLYARLNVEYLTLLNMQAGKYSSIATTFNALSSAQGDAAKVAAIQDLMKRFVEELVEAVNDKDTKDKISEAAIYKILEKEDEHDNQDTKEGHMELNDIIKAHQEEMQRLAAQAQVKH
ncbi:hypothetical protein CVT26_013646 [Gymnopilus dilepis]|uniref:Uncharacterized protein n=1 Tax=Gymnopilus dilepis TaxID=231916 RepID=A0A409YWG5_9AGAR|nr:hypothetical protein CVT26_013646 [Gymnopilus dilepis]